MLAVTVTGFKKPLRSGYVDPLYICHTLLKSQAGLTLPLAVVADVKLVWACICAVVMPVPPALVVHPDVVLSQKLLVTVPPVSFCPNRPPTVEVVAEVVTVPVE